MPIYTSGLGKTVLIVGLGNPGKKYENTRHNIGYMCVDDFANTLEFPDWSEKKDLKSMVSSHTLGNVRVVVGKPMTYMNLSGEAVQKMAHFYKVPISSIVVVHDELDIAFGQIRIRTGGSDAGNNGIKSIIQHLGPEFGRIRVGIGADTKMDSTAFVLAKFNKDEQAHLSALTQEVSSMLTDYIYSGNLFPETRQVIDP